MMVFDFSDFVNRDAEIGVFAGLLGQPYQRILLLHGLPGIGKSYLAQRLRRYCRERGIVSPLVDFRSDRGLSRADRVIQRLREQIGGTFAEQLGQAEAQIQRDLGLAPAGWAGLAKADLAMSGLFSRGSGGGVSLSGEVRIGGDVVGRDKIVIKNSSIVLNPGNGFAFAEMEAETRRNAALRAALAALQAEKQTILFFDHFEEATEDVAYWLRQHILGLHLVDASGFSNLWIVVAGRRVPLQDELDQWRCVLRYQPIGPFSEEAIAMFWMDRRGLDPASLPVIARASGGIPQLLFLMANNFSAGPVRGQFLV